MKDYIIMKLNIIKDLLYDRVHSQTTYNTNRYRNVKPYFRDGIATPLNNLVRMRLGTQNYTFML